MISITKVQIQNSPVGKSKGFIVTQADGMICFVPEEPLNADYQAVQKWMSAGNKPLPAKA
jgi:hypothetical protein